MTMSNRDRILSCRRAYKRWKKTVKLYKWAKRYDAFPFIPFLSGSDLALHAEYLRRCERAEIEPVELAEQDEKQAPLAPGPQLTPEAQARVDVLIERVKQAQDLANQIPTKVEG